MSAVLRLRSIKIQLAIQFTKDCLSYIVALIPNFRTLQYTEIKHHFRYIKARLAHIITIADWTSRHQEHHFLESFPRQILNKTFKRLEKKLRQFNSFPIEKLWEIFVYTQYQIESVILATLNALSYIECQILIIQNQLQN